MESRGSRYRAGSQCCRRKSDDIVSVLARVHQVDLENKHNDDGFSRFTLSTTLMLSESSLVEAVKRVPFGNTLKTARYSFVILMLSRDMEDENEAC